MTNRQRLGIVGSAAQGARLDRQGEAGQRPHDRICAKLSFHEETDRTESAAVADGAAALAHRSGGADTAGTGQ